MRYKTISLFLIVLIFSYLACNSQTNLRGWHACGQTWLIWEDTMPYPETYRIYRASTQITDLAEVEQIGRIFEKDWIAYKLKILWHSTLTYTIPDGSGGAYSLQENEALFVYTPHDAIAEYFAVVRDGDSAVSTENRVGPISQTLEEVKCHLQLTDTLDGASFRVFTHWIDGRENWDAGRTDYPVMANEHFNGIGQMFRVWDYPEGERPELVPLVVALHGGGGWFGKFKPLYDGVYKSFLAPAMFFCPDDGLDIKRPGGVKIQKSYWLGFWEDYNRFLLPEEQPIPDTGLVVNYTMRRVIWELKWLIENEAIDTVRISLMGGSMGARGANYLARAYPEYFASWLSLCPGIEPGGGDPFTGTAEQNLTTNLPGSSEVMQVMDLHSVLTSTARDIPFGILVGGRNDQTLAALSPAMIQAYRNLDDAGFGTHIYWDDRGHVYTEGSYWSSSFKQTSHSLTLHRSDRSFPAFHHVDHDIETPSRQPDLGNGDSESGEPWGTWGGYCSWDIESVVDSSTHWHATIFLQRNGDYPVDISPFDSVLTDISIRRPQRFKPSVGEKVLWELVSLSDSRIIQSGSEIVGSDGVISLTDVILYKEKCVLRVAVAPISSSIQKDVLEAPNRTGHLQIYPNPVSSIAMIKVCLHQQCHVKIELYTVSGQIVAIYADEKMPPGTNTFTWDASAHPPGTYICTLKTESEVIDRKILLTY